LARRANGPLGAPQLSVTDDDRLRRGKLLQRLYAFLATVTGMFEASEGQLNAAARAIAVDVDLPRSHLASNAQCTASVLRPNRGSQPIRGVIRNANGIGLILEGKQRQDGAENFAARESIVSWGRTEESGCNIEPRLGRARGDTSLGDQGDASDFAASTMPVTRRCCLALMSGPRSYSPSWGPATRR
jgi:hypothetical protein